MVTVTLSSLQSSVKKFLYGGLIISFAWSSYCIYSYFHLKLTTIATNKAQAEKDSQETAQKMDTLLLALKTVATSLANELSTTQLTEQQIRQRLEQKPTDISGLGVAYLPYAFNPSQKLLGLYTITHDTKNKTLDLTTVGDYTQASFYQETLEKGAHFLTTFLDKATSNLVIEYATPFVDTNGKQRGIVFANYTLGDLDKRLADTHVAQKGYAGILSAEGLFVYNPQRSLITTRTLATDIAAPTNKYAELAQAAHGKTAGFLEHTSIVSGQNSWVFYVPLQATHWLFFGNFIENELNLDTLSLHRSCIQAVLSFLLFCVFLGLLLAQVYYLTPINLWISMVISCLGMFFGIGFLWILANQTQSQDTSTFAIVTNNPTLAHILNTVKSKLAEAEEDTHTKKTNVSPASESSPSSQLIEIPTGIFIHEFDITGTYKADLVFDLWQRYPKNTPVPIERGFSLPQALFINQKELYRIQTDDTEIVCWHVTCTLRQNFTYYNYPFDPKIMSVHLQSVEFNQPVILIPDIEAYNLLTPTSLPFVNKDIAIDQWHMQKSFFGYQNNSYLTNFGHYTTGKDRNNAHTIIPDLYCNVSLSRSSFTSLSLNTDPVLVILILLFFLLVMTGLNLLKIEYVLGSLATLFFTSILAYTRFADTVPVQYTVFLGHFYQLLQNIIFVITVVTFSFCLNIKIPGLHYKNMIILQLLYWPIVLGFTLVVSLLYFY